jgi:serine/threonine protein kinase
MCDFSVVDNYRVGRVLGRGASAKVRLVHDQSTGTPYAMKILKNDNSPELGAAFASFVTTEIAILRQINHPNVISVVRECHNAVY